MESLVIKLAVLLACAFGLFLVGRLLSRESENQVLLPQLVPPQSESESRLFPKPAPRVGRELPFPFDMRELEAELETKYGPDFVRPKILNYYFLHTDLETGPADPANFYDDFYVEFENPANGYSWTSSYWVTTPAGLSRQIDESREAAIWGNSTLIVKRFDLKTILQAILKDYAEAHAANDSSVLEGKQNPSTDEVG